MLMYVEMVFSCLRVEGDVDWAQFQGFQNMDSIVPILSVAVSSIKVSFERMIIVRAIQRH